MHTMTLIDQMDSPFVRRVAVTMATYGLRYELSPLSVYGDFDALRQINPLGTVPVLIDGAGNVRSDAEAICAWLDSQTEQPMFRPSPACLQLIGVANLLSQKAGERYRLLRWPSTGDGFNTMVERTHIQMQAGLNLLGAGLEARSRQGCIFGHADIAAVCAARFAQAIGALVGVQLSQPPGLEPELIRREDQPGFRSTPGS
jgi:glutathione S-transferase